MDFVHLRPSPNTSDQNASQRIKVPGVTPLKRRSCRPRFRRRSIKLTETREIMSYKWVHPDEER
jgi:hypothetical protein